jgi:hypothetical protein
MNAHELHEFDVALLTQQLLFGTPSSPKTLKGFYGDTQDYLDDYQGADYYRIMQ